jgi:hypothetical protein
MASASNSIPSVFRECRSFVRGKHGARQRVTDAFLPRSECRHAPIEQIT